MTDATTRGLALLGPRGGLGPGLRAVVRRLTGYHQVLTRRRSVLSALDLVEPTVPYGPASSAVGLAQFPLSLDGPAHERARQRIVDALGASAEARGRGVAAASEGALDEVARWRVGREVDVVAALIEPGLARWVERWFGLPGEGAALLELSRLVTHAIFFDPEPSTASAVAARTFVVGRSAQERARLAPLLAAAEPGTLAAALLAVNGGDERAAAADLVGLTVGPLALGAWAAANVVDVHLAEGAGLGGAADRSSARAAWDAGVAARPPLPGVVRDNPTSRRIVGHRGSVLVPEGRILVATGCALHLDGAGDPSLAFGAGVHACLGADAIAEVGIELLLALSSVAPAPVGGTSGGLRRHPAPHGAASWPFPTGLLVRPTARRGGPSAAR